MPFLNQGSIKIPLELNDHLSRIGKYTMAVTVANVLLIATFTFAEFVVWLVELSNEIFGKKTWDFVPTE